MPIVLDMARVTTGCSRGDGAGGGVYEAAAPRSGLGDTATAGLGAGAAAGAGADGAAAAEEVDAPVWRVLGAGGGARLAAGKETGTVAPCTRLTGAAPQEVRMLDGLAGGASAPTLPPAPACTVLRGERPAAEPNQVPLGLASLLRVLRPPGVSNWNSAAGAFSEAMSASGAAD